MSQVVPLKEIREQLSDLISQVAYGDQKVVITKNGKPVAALVAYSDYEKIMNPAKRFTKEEWEKGFEFIDKAREASKNVSVKEAEKIIEKAIREVRKAKNVKSRS
ncbi:type II toxin-antitoxin system Phd/YefM family antitoxin [Candidatus Gottesmanbacteria bacterium]|nr:type II toxin-antitoxin system Phd/YefM family antitoxin [Candidatus Gottesmanbacteria bacterium]